MIGPSGRDLSRWRTTVITVLYEHLPLATRGLQSVEVESNEIVEEVALDLPTKYIYLRAEYIESVTVSPSRPLSWRQRSRPLTCS